MGNRSSIIHKNEINNELLSFLSEAGYMHLTYIPGKGVCGISHLMFTVGVFVGLDQVGYNYRYCYHNLRDALDGLSHWTGENEHPDGNWIVKKGDGGDLRNPKYIPENR